jgi:hypothetical protein
MKGEYMMHSIKEGIEVPELMNSQTSITPHSIDEDSLLQSIQQNLSHFSSMHSAPNGYLGKLAFVSSILRYHNLKYLCVEQSFDGILFGSVEDSFKCHIIAEPYTSDQMEYKDKVLDRFEQIKAKRLIEANEEDGGGGIVITNNLNALKVQPVCTQKAKIRELYEKFLKKLDYSEDAALALTSLFVFELEILSNQPNKGSLNFYDLYDLSNPLDKWFAAIGIESHNFRPLIYKHNHTLQ